MKEYKVTYFKEYAGKKCGFEVSAETLEEAQRMQDLLAFTDLYKEKVGMTGDFINSVSVYHLEKGEWVDVEEDEGLKRSDLWEEVKDLLK